MSWQQIFAVTNAIALIGWLLLVLAPRRPLTLSLVLYAAVGLLCLIYTALFIASLGGFVDPVRAPGAAPPSLADYSVRGLRALFASDGAITIGWTHYLALDLFTGGSRATPTGRGSAASCRRPSCWPPISPGRSAC